jgi:hypothetical protein
VKQKMSLYFLTVAEKWTVVGALIREAEHAKSKGDFKHKMSIPQEEINETIYRL